MATNTFTSASSWTPTSDLQPSAVSPVSLPTYSDSVATQQAQQQLVLAAGAAVTLALPPGWSYVTDVRIVNTSLTNYVNLQLGAVAGASSPVVILPPGGGEFHYTQAIAAGAAVPLLVSQVRLTAYGTWVAKGVDASGVAVASTTGLYVWLAGA